MNVHVKAGTVNLKIRRIGNSMGVVLPKEMLDNLGLSAGDEVTASLTEKGIELSHYNAELDDAMEWIEKGAKRYRNTLRALSK